MSEKNEKSKQQQGRTIHVNLVRCHHPAKVEAMAKRFANGEKLTNLDDAMFSHVEMKEVEKAQDEGRKVVTPYAYQAALVTMAMEMNAVACVAGNGDEIPSNWPSKYGVAQPGYSVGDGKGGKGLRYHHLSDIRSAVEDGALKQIGVNEYVVGVKSGDDYTPAPLCIETASRGMNYFIHAALKKLGWMPDGDIVLKTESGENVTKTEFNTLVGQINAAPAVETWEDGGKMSIMGNQTVTWGHLIKDGKALTPSQIHKLEDASGVEFVALNERWIGNAVSEKDLLAKIPSLMRKVKTENDSNEWLDFVGDREEADAIKAVATNLGTQARIDPGSFNCYGLRHVMAGQAIAKTSIEKDGKAIPAYVTILGGHLPTGLVNPVRKAKAKVAKPKAEKKEKAPKTSKKSDKPKKTKAPKASKPDKAPTETAVPPVTAVEEALASGVENLPEIPVESLEETIPV